MQTHDTSKSAGNGLRRGWGRALPWALGGAVLACFFVLVRDGYFIRAYSDCYNWLEFAENFGREFTRSRWPYGFPLFLRGALEVAGPYYVFLVNLPVMVVLFALTAWLGTLLRRDDRGGRGAEEDLPRGWAFLAVWIPVLAADASSFTRYLNPYRDPLSYVLVILSALLFVRSVARRRTWGVAAAGAVLGLASSVREPSVFMVLPLVAYGTWAWAGAKREIPFWKTVAAFALGLAAALVPFAVQTYLTTHQLVLPPQASLESQTVPGVHFDRATFASTGHAAWGYYAKHEPWLLLLALAGVVAAARRRNRLVLALVLPAAAMYVLFYSFYWTFVIRYFYVAVLFLVLAAGYGLQTFLGWMCGRWPRWGRAAGWALLAAAAFAAGGRLLVCRMAGRTHQVPQAKAFAAAFGAACPDADVVFANRYLCEWIDWFMPYASHPLPSPGSTGEGRSALLRAELGPRLERGEVLYSATWDGELDEAFLRRACDREPAGELDTTPFRAHDYVGQTLRFYRIRPWSRHRTELAWPAPCGERYWYMLDTGDPPEAETGAAAEPIAVTVDGVRQPDALPHGGARVGAGLPRECTGGGEGRAVAESAGLLPREMPGVFGTLDDPVTLDFGFYSAFDHRWRLHGEILPAEDRYHIGPRVPSAVEIEIPVPWPDRGGVLLECDVLSSCKSRGGFVDVGAYEDGRRLAGVRVPADRLVAKLLVPLPDEPERGARTVRLEVEDSSAADAPDEPPPCIELCQIRVHRRPAAYPVEIRLDGKTDAIHALSGFHPAEGRGSGAYRWTKEAAEMAVYAPEGSGGKDVRLRIAYSTKAVPPEVNGDGRIRVSWDGAALEGGAAQTEEGSGEFVWTGVLPADRVGTESPHRLRVEVPAWRPADYGSRDMRTLGVQLRRVGLEEAGGDTATP